MNTYDLIVIGAGSGGLVAAEVAAKLGARVALIEASDKLGGECLHAGCVPSKALIHAARVAYSAGHSNDIGVTATPVIDFGKVADHLDRARYHIEEHHDNDAYYQNLGVTMLHGAASLLDERTVAVGDQKLHARRIIISTGSSPAIPQISGLGGDDYLTNESIFELRELPSSLAVIGGGPIGCELGQAFAMLGSQVTIIQSGPRLLPRDEPEAVGRLSDNLKQLKVTVLLDAKAKKVSFDGQGQVSISTETGTVKAEKLLLATGRRPNLPDGLEAAGVTVNARGIVVNDRLQTSRKGIYAIGDCNGGPQFTHAAAQQATVAVQNALYGLRKRFDPSAMPWVTFTTPEIAHVGAIKDQLDKQGAAYRVVRAEYGDIDKATAEAESGYIEILLSKRSKILGATVVGNSAAEILGQVVVAKDWKTIAATLQAYPTYATGLWHAAANDELDVFTSSAAGKVARFILKLRL